MVVEEEEVGTGEDWVEAGPASMLGLFEEVGVVIACDEWVRRGKGADGSRGEAIVDIVAG
jgi:hypothetical protein